MLRGVLTLLSSSLLLAGCVSLANMPGVTIPGAAAPAPLAFPGLDDGATSLTTSHFIVRGYNDNDIRTISTMAESLYNKIGNDTGIYSYLADGTYNLVIYKDHEEYMKKTHEPTWSKAVWASSGVYVYPNENLEPVLAFQLTRLLMNNYLGDKLASTRWFVEGLAMYEEVSKMTESERAAFQASSATQIRATRMPFSQMTFIPSASIETRRTDVWYQQVQSVVAYLLYQGSPLTFASMLSELRNGTDMDRAIGDTFPAKFRNLNELESSWKLTI